MNIKIAIKTTLVLSTVLGLGTLILNFPNIAGVICGIAAFGLVWKITYIILEDKK